jgi:hypothetical protein
MTQTKFASNVLDEVRQHLLDKNKIIQDMKHLVVSRNHKILDFNGSDKDGFVEYIEGMLIRNVTSPEQHVLGVTILHVITTKEVNFELHEHEGQSQTVCVLKGKVLDLETNILFYPKESYFVNKAHKHTIKYFPDSEALLVYLPSLNTVKL